VLTIVVAVYGAAVATLSLLLSGWIFVSSGPKVQAQAFLARPTITPSGKWHVSLQVWNTGRQDIKLDFFGLTLDQSEVLPPGKIYALQLKWEGPKTPMMLAAHSGEHWFGRAPKTGNDDILAAFNNYLGARGPDGLTKLHMFIQVGGKRMVKVVVNELHQPTGQLADP
jgi:hypothetical protein